MDKYIKLYHDTYGEQRTLSTEYIKNKLIENKGLYAVFNYAHNSILKNIEVLTQQLTIYQNPYKELIYEFKKRCDYLDIKHQFTIIPNALLPKFNGLTKSSDAYPFERFIIDLATLEAYDETKRLFRNYYQLYDMMYELNKFDEFEIDNYNCHIEAVPLFKKYHAIIYGVPEESNQKVIDKKEFEKIDADIESENNLIFNFGIDENYKTKFSACYLEFTHYYIDEEKTSYDDFYNVFFKDSNKHSSIIYFQCDTKLASLLLHELKLHVFPNLTQVNICKSGMFISAKNVPFSQTTVSRTKNNANESDRRQVASTIKNLTD